MRDIDAHRLAVFDCDGVVLDSNRLKSEALARALGGEPPELVDAFIHYHKTYGGVSRYEKFRHFFTVMDPREDAELCVEAALERLSEILANALLACAEVPGVREVLERFRSAGVACAVNSGGDEAELLRTFPARGLDRYFAAVMGSPSTKEENMERLRTQGLLRTPGIYFGDARRDMETAEAYGFDFVFLSGVTDWPAGAAEARARGHAAVADFTEFLNRE